MIDHLHYQCYDPFVPGLTRLTTLLRTPSFGHPCDSSVSFPRRFRGSQERVRGTFCTACWHLLLAKKKTPRRDQREHKNYESNRLRSTGIADNIHQHHRHHSRASHYHEEQFTFFFCGDIFQSLRHGQRLSGSYERVPRHLPHNLLAPPNPYRRRATCPCQKVLREGGVAEKKHPAPRMCMLPWLGKDALGIDLQPLWSLLRAAFQ